MSKQAVINTILTMTENNPIPIENEMVEVTVSNIANLVGIVWLWWKDSPVTKASKKANAIMKAEKQIE